MTPNYYIGTSGWHYDHWRHRFITHIKRLKDTEEAVERFITRAKILGEKLGPFLYQLPPNMHRNDERLKLFLSALPRGVSFGSGLGLVDSGGKLEGAQSTKNNNYSPDEELPVKL